MATVFYPPATADSTRLTADNTLNRPVAAMAGRLRSLIPYGWFSIGGPFGYAYTRDAILVGLATALAWLRALITYGANQTRLATATGMWLDLAAFDYFGLRIQRRTTEMDPAFSARIRREILRPRVTRQAISDAVNDLVGAPPTIVEPFNPADCGAYGDGSLGYAGAITVVAPSLGFGDPSMAYDDPGSSYGPPQNAPLNGGGAGCWGSLAMPNQFFVTVNRPPGSFAEMGTDFGGYGDGSLAYAGGVNGLPDYPGFDDPSFGYGSADDGYGFDLVVPYSAGSGAYAGLPDLVVISDEEIYAAVADATAAGVIAWTTIRGQ